MISSVLADHFTGAASVALYRIISTTKATEERFTNALRDSNAHRIDDGVFPGDLKTDCMPWTDLKGRIEAGDSVPLIHPTVIRTKHGRDELSTASVKLDEASEGEASHWLTKLGCECKFGLILAKTLYGKFINGGESL